MDAQTEENLEWFFRTLEPVAAAYAQPEFSYLIHNGPDRTALISSRLVLQPLATDHPERVVEAGDFYGFSGRLSAFDVTPRELIQLLLNGYVPGADRTWKLSREVSSSVPSRTQATPAIFRKIPRTPDVEAFQQKIYELFGMGLSVGYWPSEDDEWSIRAAATPYSNVSDLLLTLRLQSDHQFHMIAFPPLVVDPTSRVRAEVAELKLRCSRHLPRAKTSLGIVVRDQGEVKERKRISSDHFEWETSEDSDEVLVGTIDIPVPKASVVHCFAVFDQHCLHHYWVGDPEACQNPLRNVYEVFDPNFEDALAMLTQSASKGQSLAQESSVAALLWVLGFAPIHLGRLSEAPDIIAISRDGHVIVVECTLSDLQTKKQNKPQKLLDRTSEIRAALERSNAGSAVCIPVMVTSRKRADIKDDIIECERKGIVVIAQEDIEPIIFSTISSPQSDVLFRELKRRLDEALDGFRAKVRQEKEIVQTVEAVKRHLPRLID